MTKNKSVICFVNTNKAWGGGEKWFAEIIERICEHYTIIAYAHPESRLFQKLQQYPVMLFPLKSGNLSFLNIIKLLRLKKQFHKYQPESVLMNLPSDVKTAGTAAMLAKIPQRIYRRGSAIPIKNSYSNRWLFKNVITRVITNSKKTKATILANNPLLFPEEKIQVIYNGIDLEAFDKPNYTKLYDPKPGEIILGNAGRLDHQKGQDFLIDLAVKLNAENRSFKILIAGSGPLKQELMTLAKKNAVSDHVLFLGFVEQMKAFMDAIDIYVHTAHWEGFGYVLVEAMADKKPVVAFDISSNPEIIADQITGFLCPYADMQQFKMHVGKLMDSKMLRDQLGANGRKRIVEHFTIQQTLQQINALLNAPQN
ncbi:MAG: glycosyltransferase [Bacteroidetes bacterium]|nr:glycosyltransferase [Bacteroidota bacterium]MBU1580575.1 glycosyltransferase [Bacteroidota bacterium]MBU2466439.1 glycosyltransferase [Bacteroidota bacterium]MBU2558206.1 glycosyltransferase [Bacteroidota bacterium]